MNSPVGIVEGQVLRGEVLNIVCGAEPYGASMETVAAFLKKKGYTIDKNEVGIICKYLDGKGLVSLSEIGNKVLGVSRSVASITPKGVDVLEGTVTVEGVELVI